MATFVVEKKSHEDLFLEEGYFFALAFREGWFCGRVINKQWSNLQPWSLGAVTAGANLATANEVQDAQNRHYLEPYLQSLVYHTFWGVAPAPAKVKWQNPVRVELGSMLDIQRSLTDNVGSIDGYRSPFWGPYSNATEIWTVKERYPAFNILNPTADTIANVKLNFDQRQYSYQIVKDKDMIRSLLVGQAKVKKVTMGTANPLPETMPQWLKDLIGPDALKFSQDTLGTGAAT